jgi:hypothetical protein
MNQQPLPEKKTTLPVGDIQFFSKIPPPLPSGDYTITSDHTVAWGSDATQMKRFQNTQQFSVQGPRFKLNVSDVHSIFPAAGTRGKYENILPQIVLKKRSLPWEHVLEKGDTSGSPWLALLVLDEEQILTPPTTDKKNLTKFTLRPLKEVRNINAEGVLGPVISHLDYGQSDNDVCQTIDISTDTFQQIVPHLDELPYLAHCRQVNVGNKVIMNMKHSGFFSVVVANRFPVNPLKKVTTQIAHVVSLEGFKPYLTDSPKFPNSVNTIRLISLYSWSFSSIPDHGKNFSDLMLNLVSTASEDNTELLLRYPVPSGSSDSSPGQIASKALSSGYLPVTYHTKFGSQTFSWYRGPLSPIKTDRFTRNSKIEHFTNASDAVIYDTVTGVFNMSYSAAWQLGRLMALSNRTFATALLKWRRQSNRLVDLIATRAKLDNISDFLKNYDDDINAWLNEQIMTDAYLKYLVSDFASQIAPNISNPIKNQAATKTRIKGPAIKKVLPEQLVEELKKLMQQPEVITLLQKLGGEEFISIVEWVAKTMLLYGVPFDYLLPDAQMLPIESIRFFYFDRAWTDSLIDGAMSIGIQCSKDSNYYKVSKDIIRKAVDKLILELREQLLGLPPSDTDSTDGTITGFLIRSEVVSGWPGLEVKGYKTVSQNADKSPIGKGEIKLLRMEHLAPDILLCLFPETPAWIELDEPKEGLCFGTESHENSEIIYIRDPKNGEIVGTATYTVNVSNDPKNGDYRDNSSRVLNIINLSTHLAAAAKTVGISDMNIADFALQMVKVPEKMAFQNKQ